MLSRLATVSMVLILFSRAWAEAEERDYLQRGEEKLTAQYQITYDRAIRDVLSRGWRRDVVLRMVDIAPFQPEWIAGIARTADGYHAFEVTASKHIWAVLDFDNPKKNKRDYRTVRPILHERPLSAPIAARVAALWRRVLAEPRNYGEDPGIYVDTDQFAFLLSFLPHEHVTAYTVGGGPKVEQVWRVSAALASYAEGMSERDLIREITKCERKLGV
jgi:hypothetical protein